MLIDILVNLSILLFFAFISAAVYPTVTYTTPQLPPVPPDTDVTNTTVSKHMLCVASLHAHFVKS